MKLPARILVATDLSAPARHAVARAFRLAASSLSQLHLLYAMEVESFETTLRELLGGDASQLRDKLLDDARQQLVRLVGEPAQHFGVAAQARVVSGTPLETIASEVDALDASLVVVGARGESFLRHALLGSTATRLLRKTAHRPVLVVKQPPHEDYRSVLIAVDFSPASLASIRLARRFAPQAEITLLHAIELPYEGKLVFAGVDEQMIRNYVSSSSEACRKRLHQLAERAGLSSTEYSVRLVRGDPAQQIIAMEQEVDADLILVGKHGTHVVEELLLGSVTKHVLSESQCDVLVVSDLRPAPDSTP